MIKENTEKKVRTPRNYQSILAGAKALSLLEKNNLRNELTLQIEQAWAEEQKRFEEIKKIAGK